jgi:hypothetical protein
VANVKAVAVVHGRRDAPALKGLWDRVKSWWTNPTAIDWSPEAVPAALEALEPDLLTRLRAAVAPPTQIATLADGKPNWILDITPDGVWVETERSRNAARPPQLVEAWMIQIAWDWLQAHGSLSNRFLLDKDGLNVKRSSFVCALLAQLPDVVLSRRRPIELLLSGRATARPV